MLQVDIQKQFGTFNLEMGFTAGDETMGLLGASGCGKSVTMRSVAGIETPDSGKIVVNDVVFFDRAKGKKPKVNLSPQQRKTALLFQNYMLFPNLTIEQNVAAGIPKATPKDERDAIVEEELLRFGLQGFNKRYPAQLSGGQQQRVALARMLAAKPGILMLDEPFSALDSHLKGVLEQNLVSLFDAFKGTILYVSHDIDEALRFCDRIAVVDAGHIMEISDGDSLVNAPQSLAAIKLSGCKNDCEAVRVGERRVHVPAWGIDLDVKNPVRDDVRAIGVRAFYVYPAEGAGANNFRVRVDRVSDSRFERTSLLSFLDRADTSVADGEATVVADADVKHESTQVDVSEKAQVAVGAAGSQAARSAKGAQTTRSVGETQASRSSEGEDEMQYLNQHLFWRTDKLLTPREQWPEEGDELWIHIDPDHIYVVYK